MSNPFAQSAKPAPAEPEQPSGNPFSQPAKGGGGDVITGDDWKTFIGNLVLFEVTGFRKDQETANGTADCVEANVTVIDAAGDGPRVFENALVFPPALVTATKECRNEAGVVVAKAGDKPYMVLGRIGKYETKAGRLTVELLDHNEQDAEVATQYLQWRAKNNMQQPQQTAKAKVAEEPPF